MSIGRLFPVTATILADTKQFSGSMDKVQAKMEEFGATTETTGQKFSNFANKASTAIIGAGVAIAAVAVDLAYKYNTALDSMQRQTNLTDAQMGKLKNQILTVSTATATSASTIVTGEQQLIKSGEGIKQSLHDVGQAAKFAQINDANLNDTLTAAIGIQKQHIGGTNGITETLNILQTAIKNSQLSANDLNSALGGRALSAFAAYHVDLRTATTILAGFADQNLKGARSTLVLKTGIAALEKPAETLFGKLTTPAQALATVRLNMTTLADEVRKPGGLLQVMDQLSTAFDHNASTAMKAQGIAAWMQQIFGTSAGPAFTNLITRLPQLTALYNKMNTSSGGAVNSGFSQWLTSPAGAVAKFKTVLENSAIKLGDVLLPKLTVGLIDATKIITGVLASHTKTTALADTAEVLLAFALSTKAAEIGVAIAEGFGVTVAGGMASVIGASIALGVLAFFVGKPGQADFTKTHAEFNKNKAAGAYDTGALIGNTFLNIVNKGLHILPGHPAIPTLPIIGPNYTQYDVPGRNASFLPKTTVTHKATLKAIVRVR